MAGSQEPSWLPVGSRPLLASRGPHPRPISRALRPHPQFGRLRNRTRLGSPTRSKPALTPVAASGEREPTMTLGSDYRRIWFGNASANRDRRIHRPAAGRAPLRHGRLRALGREHRSLPVGGLRFLATARQLRDRPSRSRQATRQCPCGPPRRRGVGAATSGRAAAHRPQWHHLHRLYDPVLLPGPLRARGARPRRHRLRPATGVLGPGRTAGKLHRDQAAQADRLRAVHDRSAPDRRSPSP